MRQHSVTSVGSDRAAMHLHPQSDLHLDDHLSWSRRRQESTIPLDLEEWCILETTDDAQFGGEHHVMRIDALGHELGADAWSTLIGSERDARSHYTSDSGRRRTTQGVRSTSIAIAPWFAHVLRPDVDTPILAEMGVAAMLGLAEVTGFPCLGAAIVFGPDRLSCSIVYATVAADPQNGVNRRIVSTAPGVDKNNKPVLLGGAALATTQLQFAGMLPDAYFQWVDRRSLDQSNRGKLPVDYFVADRCIQHLTSALQREGRGQLLRTAKDSYAERVKTAIERATDPEWRVLQLEEEIAELQTRAAEIGAVLPPAKQDLLDRVEAAGAILPADTKRPVPDREESSASGVSKDRLLDVIRRVEVPSPQSIERKSP